MRYICNLYSENKEVSKRAEFDEFLDAVSFMAKETSEKSPVASAEIVDTNGWRIMCSARTVK